MTIPLKSASARFYRTAALALAGLFVAPAGAAAADLADRVEALKPSVVAVGTWLPTRRPPALFRGTGWAVADGRHVVTNAHVLPELVEPDKKEQLGVFVGSGRHPEFRPARKVALDEEHDLALLAIEGPALPALPLSDTPVRDGQAVAFTGFPLGIVLGLYPVTHRGIVSAISPVVIPNRSSRQLDAKSIQRLKDPWLVYQLDATAYPGNSGSAVYDPESGAVIGVINSVFVKETKESAITNPSGITYAIPVEHVRALLSNAGIR